MVYHNIMKSKKVCTIVAGAMNLVYAVIFTVGLGFAVVLIIMSLVNINNGGNDVTAGLQALVGVLLIGIAIIAALILVVLGILTWISAIGLLKRGIKGKPPARLAILSIVTHSLIVTAGLVGAILLLVNNGGALIVAVLALIALSVANIVLSAIARTGGRAETPAATE